MHFFYNCFDFLLHIKIRWGRKRGALERGNEHSISSSYITPPRRNGPLLVVHKVAHTNTQIYIDFLRLLHSLLGVTAAHTLGTVKKTYEGVSPLSPLQMRAHTHTTHMWWISFFVAYCGMCRSNITCVVGILVPLSLFLFLMIYVYIHTYVCMYRYIYIYMHMYMFGRNVRMGIE